MYEYVFDFIVCFIMLLNLNYIVCIFYNIKLVKVGIVIFIIIKWFLILIDYYLFMKFLIIIV